MKDYHKARLGVYVSMPLIFLGYAILILQSTEITIGFILSAFCSINAFIAIILLNRRPIARAYVKDISVFIDGWSYEDFMEVSK